MIRIGVVGCGYWGPNYIRVLSELPDCEVAVCCDIDKARLLPIKKNRPNIRTTVDFEEVLEDKRIDAVCISTPASTHYSLAMKCLERGKSLLIEKPLTLKVSEAEALVKEADRREKILMVGHIYLYHPVMNELEKRIRRGDLGDLYYIYSVRTGLGPIRSDTNAMWDLAPHDISMILSIAGTMPETVTAVGSSFLQPGVQDLVFLNMKFSNGLMAQVHVSWLDLLKSRRLTVVGSKKMAVFDDIDISGKLKISEKNVSVSKNTDSYEFLLSITEGDTIIPKIDVSEPLKNMCRSFLECLENGKQPTSSGQNALNILRVLEAGQASLDNQGVPTPVKKT